MGSIEDNDWNILCDTLKEEEVKEEVKEECIYLILINNKPYGYYYDKEDTDYQVEKAKEYIREQHLYDFKKDYYWRNLHIDEFSDTIVKMALLSNIKDIFITYNYTEDTLEIVKTLLKN